ncbi:MAG: DUF4440 domain-containing protein [Candidatus Eisenbacteria bacterium]|nr:DUF4440 domain-containing protein [Candidatus Eisenbacteria bacterium]MCC7141586.1 DUF4440 domain-containing protein [Candidatus Eisenbacteria bacterium]
MNAETVERDELLEASERIWLGLRSGGEGTLSAHLAPSFELNGYPAEDHGDGIETLRRFFAEGEGLTSFVHNLVGLQVLDDVGVVQARWIAERGLGEDGSPSYLSGRVTLTFRRIDNEWKLRGWIGARGPHDPETMEDRAADVQAIREQILRVFEAYRQKDLAMLRRTHTSSWRGFSLRSGAVGKGIDAYMRGAQGAIGSMQFQEYRLLELDAIFYGDLAIVPYVARIAGQNRLGRDEAYRLRVIDVYLREPLGWNQVATNVCPHPEDLGQNS